MKLIHKSVWQMANPSTWVCRKSSDFFPSYWHFWCIVTLSNSSTTTGSFSASFFLYKEINPDLVTNPRHWSVFHWCFLFLLQKTIRFICRGSFPHAVGWNWQQRFYCLHTAHSVRWCIHASELTTSMEQNNKKSPDWKLQSIVTILVYKHCMTSIHYGKEKKILLAVKAS